MLVYEYKLDGNKQQFAAIEKSIRTAQFIRNKCLRLWMDGTNVSKNDLQTYCAVLAKAFPVAPRSFKAGSVRTLLQNAKAAMGGHRIGPADLLPEW
jgi:hypothetical protein